MKAKLLNRRSALRLCQPCLESEGGSMFESTTNRHCKMSKTQRYQNRASKLAYVIMGVFSKMCRLWLLARIRAEIR